jgi:hypothetical protein
MYTINKVPSTTTGLRKFEVEGEYHLGGLIQQTFLSNLVKTVMTRLLLFGKLERKVNKALFLKIDCCEV